MKTKPKRTRHANYPWRIWIHRGSVRLRRERDYPCTDRVMMLQIRNAAYRNGVSVSVRPWIGGVIATFSGKE